MSGAVLGTTGFVGGSHLNFPKRLVEQWQELADDVQQRQRIRLLELMAVVLGNMPQRCFRGVHLRLQSEHA